MDQPEVDETVDTGAQTALAAPTRERPAVTPYRHPAAAGAIDALERALGGREALIDVLLAAPATDELTYVVGLIADPSSDPRKLSQLCRRAGVTVGELLAAYKAGALAKAQAAVFARLAERLPAVADDLLTRAAPHYIPCPTCQGEQVVPNLKARGADGKPIDPDDAPKLPCPDCRQQPGYQLVYPDLARQKLALELAELGPKTGPSVVVDQRDQRTLLAGIGTPASHVGLTQAVDAVLYRTPRAAASPSAPPPPAQPAEDPV